MIRPAHLFFCLCLCVFFMTLPAHTARSAGKKTLRLAMSADPVTLDPHMQLSGDMLTYSHMVFDPLVRWTREMTFEPRLAVRWKRLNTHTIRFFLRKNVTFHSGNPFTAHDVQWTFQRLQRSPDYKALFEPFEEVVIVDDHTVDIKTKTPYPLLLNMATYLFCLDSKFYTGTDDAGQPKDAIVKIGPSFALSNVSGTGPFQVTFREQGVKMELTRFASYWDTATGNIDKIILTPVREDAARTQALLSGKVDFIMPVSPPDYETLEKNDKVNLLTMAGSRIITLQLNSRRKPEFADSNVRKAIVYAIDNAGIVKKLMRGKAMAAGQQSPEGFLGYDPALTPRFDLKKAQQYIKQSAYPDGFSCTMIAPDDRYVNDEEIAQAVVSMLAAIGIQVDLKTMPKARYWDEFDARAADIQMIGWHPDTEDSANFTEYLALCPDKEKGYGQYNSGNYCNKAVDELIGQARVETDMEKRADLLQKVERVLYDDAAFVPLHWEYLSWAARTSIVNPYKVINVMNFPYFGDLQMQQQ